MIRPRLCTTGDTDSRPGGASKACMLSDPNSGFEKSGHSAAMNQTMYLITLLFVMDAHDCGCCCSTLAEPASAWPMPYSCTVPAIHKSTRGQQGAFAPPVDDCSRRHVQTCLQHLTAESKYTKMIHLTRLAVSRKARKEIPQGQGEATKERPETMQSRTIERRGMGAWQQKQGKHTVDAKSSAIKLLQSARVAANVPLGEGAKVILQAQQVSASHHVAHTT
jgi:hypothetical protein